jgi:ceramide glucosyltransferase
VNFISLALVALGWGAFVLAVAGVAYTAMSGLFVRRFFRPGRIDPAPLIPEAATILKPLHGDEPGLHAALQSVFDQDYSAPVQRVFGTADPNDPARIVAQALIEKHPGSQASLCVESRQHGRNAKVSNLINMMSLARNPLIVLSDSDIMVSADYLRRVHKALAGPGVGVVTCPYFGEWRSGFWSEVAAMGISYQFLSNLIAGVSLGLAKPCLGSTIALRLETLQRIGGFEAFRDVLADDYAIGAAVRNLGLTSLVAPVLVSHGCAERTLGEVFSHELRWARTIRGVDPAGHAGSLVTHPWPLALLAVLCIGFSAPVLILLAASFLVRVWLMRTVDGVIGRALGPWWLLPMRDMLSFAVFVGSFFGRSVEWRGVRFHVTDGGDLKPV